MRLPQKCPTVRGKADRGRWGPISEPDAFFHIIHADSQTGVFVPLSCRAPPAATMDHRHGGLSTFFVNDRRQNIARGPIPGLGLIRQLGRGGITKAPSWAQSFPPPRGASPGVRPSWLSLAERCEEEIGTWRAWTPLFRRCDGEGEKKKDGFKGWRKMLYPKHVSGSCGFIYFWR